MYRFSFPTMIYFGAGTRAKVAENLLANKVKRPLLVTDRGIAPLDFCKNISQSLTEAGLESKVFAEIWGNPVKSQVTAGVEAYRQHRADGIVGLGGGAALDVAKAIALMVSHPGDLFDYEDDKPGARPVDGPIPYWVAIPTTAGTGSEVGRSSVISDDETHIKKIIFDPKLLAKAVFADPELTLDLPKGVTAATGMDALTHCVEAFLAKGYHPICDGIALEGLRLAGQNLTKVVQNPRDIDARAAMLMASMMGAIAFQKGLGITHSCAHALGTVVDMHHGLANAVMIDHALRFNVSVVPERFQRMAQTLNLDAKDPNSFFDWLRGLKEALAIPANLTKAGVDKKYLPKLIDTAVADACHPSNPRAVSREDFRAVFTSAF